MPKRKDAISRLFSRVYRRKRPSDSKRRRLSMESLEGRRLLAVTGTSPAIMGTVFTDTNQDSMPSPGEGISGAIVQLYLDDGNGIFDGGDTQIDDDTTDVDGMYCFENLDGAAQFFVVQPAQVADGLSLDEQVSGLIRPGEETLIIDEFETSQSVKATPPAPSSDGSTLQFANENEVIGGERDMFVEMRSGIGEVELRVNPFNLLPVLQYDSTSGVEGSSIVTWDGIDNDPGPIPSLGLNGRDLTQNGANTGFTMMVGIDASGAGDTVAITLFQGSVDNSSTASAPVPVTDGTATGYLFIPFSDFSGPVSADNVDAIQLVLGEGVPSSDAQIAFLGVTGPRIQNFPNSAGTDLSITKTDGATSAVAGEDITYTITVRNLGPLDVVGASVEDLFPPELENVSYTSTTTGTVSGNTTTGNGDIRDTVDMTMDSTIVYTVNATIASNATGTLINTATVQPPEGVNDPDPTNNVGLDRNPLRSEVDLIMSKSDGLTDVAPGAQFAYTIIVSNPGPSDVIGATVTDIFPPELTNVTYTSSVTNGTVTGNTNGSGNINDTLSMSAGSTLEYVATVTVDLDATGTIINTATVAVPDGTIERDPSNNSSTDTTTITPVVDLAISKTDNADNAVPGNDLTYQIVVQNLGPIDVTGATVEDLFPSDLTNVTYSSTATGSVSGNTANGSGNIQDTVSMAAGSSLTYTATGTVAPSATGQLVNTATVAPPDGIIDSEPGNNSATDTNNLRREVDVAVTKGDGETTAAPGQVLNYTMTVSNSGPSDVTGVEVSDLFPTELSGVTFTSTAQSGASGNTASGAGNISDTVNLPVNSSITYSASGTVIEAAGIDVSNTINASVPNGVTDTDPSNNSATDVNTLLPGVDLQVTKTNNQDGVRPGEQLTYEIVVRNNGPNPVSGARAEDNFPAELINVSYTSSSNGTAAGNTTDGTGNIDDVLDLGVNAAVTYIVSATIASDATGTLSNTATVTAPDDVTELDPSNNSATDTDAITESQTAISGFVFLDRNNNGVFDPGESPVGDAQVVLEDENGVEITSVFTNDAGAYAFDPLAAGSYFVQQIVPDGFRAGKNSDGGDFGESIENGLFFVTLDDGDVASDLDFGLLPAQPSKRELLASSFG